MVVGHLITNFNPVFLPLKLLKFACENISHLHTFVSVTELKAINLMHVLPQLMLTTHYNCQPNALRLTARLKLSSSDYLKQATSRCIFLLRQQQLLRYNISVYILN
jgi:hypothetical protein